VNVWDKEPALVIAVVQAILVLVIAFGVHITDSQVAAIVGVASAVLALLAGVATRSQVIPKGPTS
jgi:uncharacterized membrane protein